MNEKRNRARTPNNKTTTGFRISDELGEVLQPLLPEHRNTHPLGGGRPRRPDRECADAIFYVLRTGCRWKALDDTDLVPGSTAHDRFQEWVEAGVFLKLWQVGVERFDELKGIDWEWLSMDGAITKAPLGGEDTGRNPTDRGKQGTNMKLVRETIENTVVDRPEPTEEHPQNMCLDKGYDYPEGRDTLREFGFTAHIRARGEEAKEFAKEAGKRARRWVVEEPTVG